MCSSNDCSRPATSRRPWRPWVGHLGGELAAVGVIEIGGLNAVAAVLAAARLGAPVLDGDLMGRAFPRINRTTVTVTVTVPPRRRWSARAPTS
ncbi:S-methyl thiohydantoin desulfurase domain-containing protein [Streptomyces nodosus]|uniref:S-methyl thiohydantoin desulfurase domain-containing protein n=1 Tax=Streptomyces nodosus TaxID=40318 RepID=UPI0038057A6D